MADRYKIVRNDIEDDPTPPDILKGEMLWYDNNQAKPVPRQSVFFQAGNKYYWGRYNYSNKTWDPIPEITEPFLNRIRDKDVSRWAPLPVIGGAKSDEVREYASLAQKTVIEAYREFFERTIANFNMMDYICDYTPDKKPNPYPLRSAVKILDNEEELSTEEELRQYPNQRSIQNNSLQIRDEDEDFFDQLLKDA